MSCSELFRHRQLTVDFRTYAEAFQFLQPFLSNDNSPTKYKAIDTAELGLKVEIYRTK